MRLKDLFHDTTQVDGLGGWKDLDVTAVVDDSRRVTAGSLFASYDI